MVKVEVMVSARLLPPPVVPVFSVPPLFIVTDAVVTLAVTEMVWPLQILTISIPEGELPAAVPPQATVDQVDEAFQFPLALE